VARGRRPQLLLRRPLAMAILVKLTPSRPTGATTSPSPRCSASPRARCSRSPGPCGRRPAAARRGRRGPRRRRAIVVLGDLDGARLLFAHGGPLATYPWFARRA
jgi:hypothetical protein